MHPVFRLVLALVLLIAPAWAARKPAKKTPRKASSKITGSKRASHRRGKAGRSSHTAPVARSQAAPTEDRYREIQQALAAKGYLKSEPTGAWDSESQDAMRRFQADQKLDQTGKINALSLITLGLGPKH